MIRLQNIIFAFVSVLLISVFVQADHEHRRSRKDASHNRVSLSPGVYDLMYFPDSSNSIVNVVLTAKHLGWIGFGINTAGKMEGADIAVGGMKNGKPFLQNHKGGDHFISDTTENTWTLLSNETNINSTHTKLHLQINLSPKNSKSWIIWSFGDGDTPAGHKGNRGAKELNIMQGGSSPSQTTTESPKPHSSTATTSTSRPRTTPTPDAPGGASSIFPGNQSPLFYFLFTCTILFTKQLF